MLYNKLNTDNNAITNTQLVNLSKDYIFDNSRNILLVQNDTIPTDTENLFYKGIRTISLRKNREDITSDTFRTTIKDISNNFDPFIVDEYVTNLNTDLSLNLTNFDLSNADLTGIDLINATLNNTDLSGTNLSSAKLTNVDLSGANITNTDLNNADLWGVKNIENVEGTPQNLPTNLKIL